MTDEQIERVVRMTVRETLTTVGLDCAHPLDMQKDLAFIRRMRKYSEQIGSRIVCIVVGTFVVFAIGGLWLAIKGHLGKS